MSAYDIAAWIVPPGSNQPEPMDLRASTLDEGTQQLPAGSYTTFRTYGGTRVARLEEHFRRLEESARLMGKPARIERARLRRALRVALEAYPAPERRVRLALDLEGEGGAFSILIEGLHVPSEGDYANGVRTVTRPMQRENPKAKQTAFIETAARVRRALPPGLNEALMVGPDGRVLEGLSSNFYAVLDGVIWTAGEGVLAGITRQVVLESIQAGGIPLRLEGARLEDLTRAEECFLTSASRDVLPVTEIDGRPVDEGRPGPVSRALLQAYRGRIEAELEAV